MHYTPIEGARSIFVRVVMGEFKIKNYRYLDFDTNYMDIDFQMVEKSASENKLLNFIMLTEIHLVW